MIFYTITQERFNAFFYGRTPYVKLFATELEWFVHEREEVTLLATILRCEIDKDFNAIVLGRDLDRKFRAIHIIVSKETRDEIFNDLNQSIKSLVNAHVDGLFPQGDEKSSPFSIFSRRVSEEKRNRYIKLLTDDPVYYPAKVMMEELAHWFDDPDGIYIRGLQGNEFNSRLFELYLQVMFHEQDFEIDRSHNYPDYLIEKAGKKISVEAVTINEPELPEEKEKYSRFPGKEEYPLFCAAIESLMPFKFSRVLQKKVGHKPEPDNLNYWDLPHTKGLPFIIAIQDYTQFISTNSTSLSMQEFLYGLNINEGEVKQIERHHFENRTIKSNFFGHPNNKHVSAILLSTGATLPKFNRMGRIAGLKSPNSFAMVEGMRTDKNAIVEPFVAFAEHPSYKESWSDGIFIFHNPNAIYPLEERLFPRAIHVYRNDEGILQCIPPNFIVSSRTWMTAFDETEFESIWNQIDSLRKE